jgi:mono/diheme cytochrome c family protein
VVQHSTQHLSETDLQAMATFLKSLPQHEAAPRQPPAADGGVLTQGRQVYDEHCAGCHGAQGQGVPGLYPALAGNRAVALPSPNNVIKAILHGGFSPATAGNPRPFGMPPYAQALSDEQIAAVASHLRQSWGHAASAVSTLDVLRAR